MGGFFTSPTWSPYQPPIPIGSVGQVLTVTAGGLRFQNPSSSGSVGSGRATASLSAGANNNLSPASFPGSGATQVARLILTAGSGPANVTGLLAGNDGQWLTIMNDDPTNNITLNSLNAGSTAANQFQYFMDLILSPSTSVVAVYDATLAKWLLN